MVALRSVLLPLVSVAFNLLTAAATFGILTLLTTGDDPILGGPGYIDPLQIIETFAAVFGIALVYEMLLLYRTRELFIRNGRSHEALAQGLRETAGAATGAAAVMVAAIVPFAMSGLFNLRLTVGPGDRDPARRPGGAAGPAAGGDRAARPARVVADQAAGRRAARRQPPGAALR